MANVGWFIAVFIIWLVKHENIITYILEKVKMEDE